MDQDSSLCEYDFLGRSMLSEESLKVIQEQKEKILKILLSKMLLSIEINDKKSTVGCTKTYLYLNKYHNIPTEQIRLLLISLDNSIEKNITDIYYINSIVSFMTKLVSIYKKVLNITINWKNYYKLYEMFYKLTKTSCISLVAEKNHNYFSTNFKFILKAKKFFKCSTEDYDFIKKDVYRFIFSNKTTDISLGVDLAKLFLPEENMSKDSEIQEYLFKLMISRPEYSNSILVIFHKIMKKHNCLLVDKVTFINSFFELLTNYFSTSSNKIGKNNKVDFNNMKNKQKTHYKPKYTISYSMCWIFVYICTNDDYLNEYKELITKDLHIFVNFMNMNLGETQSKIANTILNVLVGIMICVKKILFKKEIKFMNKLEQESFYLPIEENQSKVKNFISNFIPLIIKCLFYYEDDASMLMESLMDITFSYEIDEVIFTTYLVLLSQSENDYSLFYSKLTSYINVFMNIENIANVNVVNFLNKIILMCPGLITAAQEEQNINILFFMNTIYGLINEKKDLDEYKQNKHFNLIKTNVFNVSVEIVVRVMQLFDFIANNSIHFFFLDFIHLCSNTNTKENIDKIQKLILNYPKNNTISVDLLSIFFLIVYYANFDLEDTSLQLWKYVLENMIISTQEAENSKNLKVNSCRFMANYDLLSIKFSLQEHKKQQLIYYREFISCMEFKALNNEKVRKEMTEVIALCLNSNERRYTKIGLTILCQVVTSTLNKKFDKNTGKYFLPNEKDISFIVSLYKIFVLPYIEFIKKTTKSFEDECKNNDDIEIWLLENFENEGDLQEIMSLSFRLMNIFIVQIENPYLLNILEFPVSSIYQPIFEIREIIKNVSLDIFSFLKKTKLLKNAKLHKYYLNLLINDSIDQNKHALEKYNICLKKVKLYYEHLNKEKLGLTEFLNHQYFSCAMMRYFKINCDEELLEDVNLAKYGRGKERAKKEDEYIIKKIKVLARLFVSSIDENSKNNIFDSMYGIYNKLTPGEWEKLYNDIYEDLYHKTFKIVNKSVSINNKNKIYNILFFYSSVLNFALIKKSELYVKVLENYIKLTFLFKEDSNISLALTIIETKIIKKKYYFPLKFTLLKNRLKCLCSFTSLNDTSQNKDSSISKDYLIKNGINIEKEQQKINSINNSINNSIRVFLDQYLLNFDAQNNDFFNETVNQLLSIYIIDLLITICDPADERDYILLLKYVKCIYSLYVKKEISTLNMKKILGSFLSLLLQLLYEVQYTFNIRYIKEDDIKNSSDLQSYNENYLKNKVYISNNKPVFTIEKKKKQELNHELIKSYDDLKLFIQSLLTVKDLISDQQKIKINNEQSTTMTSINKHSEYKMIYQLFDLNFNEEIINYSNICKIFSEIDNPNGYDVNVRSMIFCQTISALLKKNIVYNRYNYTYKNLPIPIEKIQSIKIILEDLMKMYTNNQNKIIDNCLIKLFIYIINACTPKDFILYFKNQKENKFMYFAYGNELSLQIFAILSTVYTSCRIHYLFDNCDPVSPNESTGELRNHYEVIEYYLKNEKKLLANTENVIILIETLLLASKSLYYEPKTFLFSFHETTATFIKYLVNLSTESETNKEIRKVIFVNVFLLQKYFINYPPLLINILIELADLNGEYIASYPSFYFEVGSNFFLSIKNEIIKEYLILINKKIEKGCLGLNFKKFFLDFLINILKANLYRVIQDEQEILHLILQIMNNCEINELREYIMNNLLVFYINSATDEKNKMIIQTFQKFLSYQDGSDPSLVTIFPKDRWVGLYVLGSFLKGYYLYVPSFIQDIIVFFKLLNKNIYKNVGMGSKLIKQIVNEFLAKYEYSLYYVKESLNIKCRDAITNLTNTNSYFS